MPLNNPVVPSVLIQWLAASVNLVNDAARVATLNWTDADITAQTSPIAKFALLELTMSQVAGAVGNVSTIGVRKNGAAPAAFPQLSGRQLAVDANYQSTFVIVALDPGQIFEYTIIVGAGSTITTLIDLLGYIE